MNTPVTHPKTSADAAEILKAGGVCAFPTETVYGLGADATNADAVLKIYQTKGRPRFNPLIVHCADMAMAENLVVFTPLARKLADAFWPGPLSIVLPLKQGAGIADIVTAGLDTLAVRVPAHELAQTVVVETGKPLAAPSANPSGRLSATSADQVLSGFGGTVPVLDGGPCKAGLESTIIGFDDGKPVQLRAGAIARGEIEDVLGMPVGVVNEDGAVKAPGMLLNHYAPNAHLRLNADAPEPDEAYLAFGSAPNTDGPLENLSPESDLVEAARNLFSMLHALDATGAERIAVAPIPDEGLGEAINDRLQRAAAPRE